MAAQLYHRLEPWHTLHRKVVMVTGAASGLGRDFCLNLAKAGCKIVAAARRVDRLISVCYQINQSTSSEAADTRSLPAVAVELDVCADGSTIDKSVHKAWDAFGYIDAIVNNAGFRGSVRSPLELSEEKWNHVFKTNLTGCWMMSKSVCIRMRDAQIKGSIINISSVQGLNSGQFPGATAYATSKVGVNMLTKAISFDMHSNVFKATNFSKFLFYLSCSPSFWICTYLLLHSVKY